MRNNPIQNRQYNRGRLRMKISPQLGIRNITAGAGGGPEVMRTFPVMNVQNCSTDRSRSRRRHGPGGIHIVPVIIMNIGQISAYR